MPENIKQLNLGVKQESSTLPFRKDVAHHSLVRGDLASKDQAGCGMPLTANLPFAGLGRAVGEDFKGYVCSLFVRGAMCVKVEGLSGDVKIGSKIFAKRAGIGELFTSNGPGVEIGTLLAVESLERSIDVVGFKLADDPRPLRLLGTERVEMDFRPDSAPVRFGGPIGFFNQEEKNSSMGTTLTSSQSKYLETLRQQSTPRLVS